MVSAFEDDFRTIKQHYEQVLKLVHTYEPPPHDFDPLKASNQLLARYGLPERPPADSERETLKFWTEILSPPTQVIRPEFPDVRTATWRIRAFGHSRRPDLRARFAHLENSRNWSGVYITPIRPSRFLQVGGTWNVAAPSLPRVPPSGVDRNTTLFRSSTWIGIGGHRSYNTLPQVGTLQDVMLQQGQPTVETGAWWQWWIKDKPAHHVPIPILNFPVQVNDKVLAMLTVEAPWPGDVRFNLKNQRTGQMVAFKVQAPGGIVPLGATAEWIHERPAQFGSDYRYPLPKCRPVIFNRCLAHSSRDFGQPMTVQRLDWPARQVRMAEIFDTPHRSALISIPKKARGLRIRYLEPGRQP